MDPHDPTYETVRKGSTHICNLFNQEKPFFIGRNGTIETEVIYYWIVARYQQESPRPYPERFIEQIQRNAGIFPPTPQSIDAWCAAYCEALREIDGLAAGWYKPLAHIETSILETFAKRAKFRTPLRSLEPYYVEPALRWTQHLTGKNVAVVSSFAGTIQQQIESGRAKKAWKGAQEGLLDLSGTQWSYVRTYYAPTVALGKAGWPWHVGDWQAAVKMIVERVEATGAKIALIGCGGLGMLIGAELRRRGISSILLGGAIQVLFGIKGRRWMTHDVISNFWNPAWVWPAAEETPGAATFIEGGCYWGNE